MNKSILAWSSLFLSLPVLAATPINLSMQPSKFIWSTVLSSLQIKETSRMLDFNNTMHIRIAQTFRGYKVWGADAVMHLPQASLSDSKVLAALINERTQMNGIMYKNLNKDLDAAPTLVFSQKQMQAAIDHFIKTFSKKNNLASIQNPEAQLIVYVDDNHKARWAFKMSVFIPSLNNSAPQKPTAIVDALNFDIYHAWNDIKTNTEMVSAGGLAGNHKTGQKILDGLTGHQPSFSVQRDPLNKICYMKTNLLIVEDAKNGDIVSFSCIQTDTQHNNLYWNANFDQVETTWSPSNDVMFGAEMTRKMYEDWYHIPMLVKKGKPMLLNAFVHDEMTNAYWNDDQVVFGDSIGSKIFNPFTQLDTVAHEISHGFTEQHSDLVYYDQSGGLNEAYSDMAGIAAEYYAYGKTEFLVGWGDVKANNKALRYMEQPSKDCEPGDEPGYDCSIDNMSQYKKYMEVHFSSGIFNRAYYTLANTKGWNTKKAFDVMVQANLHYWTSRTTFAQAACGVLSATRDYKYDVDAVKNAFEVVGLNIKSCK